MKFDVCIYRRVMQEGLRGILYFGGEILKRGRAAVTFLRFESLDELATDMTSAGRFWNFGSGYLVILFVRS